jgi:hypothetical protein
MENELRLNLYHQYDRKAVHDIFDPFSPFTVGSGTWGIHGIVKIPNREGDYVFFVTFGQAQLGHEFDEEVTEEGVLTWQSQPKQTLSDMDIINFINHDYLKNNIYLFLRTRKKNPTTKKTEPFTYLGELAYLNHDTEREAPVHFKWQILNWSIPPQEILQRMKLKLTAVIHDNDEEAGTLLQTAKPRSINRRRGVTTREFRARHIDFSESNERNRTIGLGGELLVLDREKKILSAGGHSDLTTRILHTSVIEGDGAGYDIQSYREDGSIKFIEVKTTTGGINTPFVLTVNEVAFSKIHPDYYVLYRVYDFNPKTRSGKFYILEGDITELLQLEPTQFRASIN